MTDLRECMHDTVGQQHADLDTLATRARSQGTSLRRRRRLAVAGSAVAVVALVATTGVAGAGLLANRQAEQQLPPAATDQGPPPPAPAADTTRATGRTTAAALYAAVTDLVPGTGSEFAGQGPEQEGAFGTDTFGEFAFSPADGTGDGNVQVNVQDPSILDDDERGISAREGFVCRKGMEDCRVETQADGSLLRTYAERTPAAEGGTGERLVAEHLTDQLRVVASASNGFEGSGDHWDITRPQAVLSIDQLTTVVMQEWWGFDLPAEFAGERDVPSYEEHPCCMTATPVPQD
jgi:hypothetical protein